MKQQVPPVAIGAIAVVVVGVLAFFIFQATAPPSMSPAQMQQEQKRADFQAEKMQLKLGDAPGATQMGGGNPAQNAEAAARGGR